MITQVVGYGAVTVTIPVTASYETVHAPELKVSLPVPEPPVSCSEIGDPATAEEVVVSTAFKFSGV